jgi:hypothetical protein
MKARDMVAAIVEHGLAPALKRGGFRKQQLNFARRRGSVAHFLQVQLSSWNQGSAGAFYVNVGVMFDQMREHFGSVAVDIPKHDDCQFMVRLEQLFPEAPVQWTVDAGTDVAAVSDKLVSCVLRGVVEPLNQVSSLAEFQHLGWLHAVPWGFPAYYYYLLGDLEQARELVKAEAECFAHRGVTYDGLVQRYRFAKLER